VFPTLQLPKLSTPAPEPAVIPFPSTTGFRLGHRAWLDGLRGLAVLAVLGQHLRLLPGGSLGVDVFFVLSGFLITTLLAEEWERRGSIHLPRFYLRRALRLMPAFAVLLVICYVAVAWFQPEQARAFRQSVLVAACYLTNWPTLHGTSMSVLGHTWSLAVEEQFYLIWPLLLLAMLRARLSQRTILVIVGVGIVLAAGHRALLFDLRPPPGPDRLAALGRIYTGLDTRADGLLVGCLVGLLAVWNRLPSSGLGIALLRTGSVLAVVGLCYLFAKSGPDHHTLYNGMFTGVALMVGVLIMRQLVVPSHFGTRMLQTRPLVGVGRISYALYLCHVPIIHVYGVERLGWHSPLTSILVAAMCVGTAVLSFFLIERPCLRLKGRLQAREPRVYAARVLVTSQPEWKRAA
jgi:peptidoglycan/LPS O-acetylase OafA/YrhL